jgi:hypothetical protein
MSIQINDAADWIGPQFVETKTRIMAVGVGGEKTVARQIDRRLCKLRPGQATVGAMHRVQSAEPAQCRGAKRTFDRDAAFNETLRRRGQRCRCKRSKFPFPPSKRGRNRHRRGRICMARRHRGRAKSRPLRRPRCHPRVEYRAQLGLPPADHSPRRPMIRGRRLRAIGLTMRPYAARYHFIE